MRISVFLDSKTERFLESSVSLVVVMELRVLEKMEDGSMDDEPPLERAGWLVRVMSDEVDERTELVSGLNSESLYAISRGRWLA